MSSFGKSVVWVVVGLLSLSAWAGSASARSVAKGDPSCGAPVAAAPVCCPPCIDYRHHRGCKCFDPCKTKEVILQVKDPCTCCIVEVPVCIPCCCEGAPEMCCYKGFLKRDVVEYSWCCGFYLKVVFNRHGDVTVHYYGV
jgi:hypothetical protein